MKNISLEGKFKDLLIMADEDPFLKGIVEVDINKERVPIVYNNTLAGFYTPRQMEYNGKLYWRTGAIYILPQYRRLGLASKTIKEFFENKGDGITIIDVENTASLATFKNAGFVIVETNIGKISKKPVYVLLKHTDELKPAFLSW